MRQEIQRQLATASYIDDQGLQYGYLLSLFRYVLQMAAYSAFEATSALADPPEQMQEQGLRLLQPSDGEFTATLDLCIPALRTVWPTCSRGWFDARGTEHHESGSEICSAIISKRNDRIGHGVFDKGSLTEQLEKLPIRIATLIDILSDLLPIFSNEKNESEVAELKTPAKNIRIEVARRHRDGLILIRRIENRGSVWRLRGQVLSHISSNTVLIEISDKCHLLQCLQGSSSSLVARNIRIGSKIWRASTLLPFRQTQTFEGRSKEIDSLLDWWQDVDSRACLVYGEGGIGKTTLVLEFLNDILDEPPVEIDWRPELIFFYSAKLTRWGVAGLEQIGGINANVNEGLRSLARLLESRLGREWQTEDSRSLIARTAQLFQDAGLTRNSILVVFDNTETLARSVAEEAGLGKILREVSTKIGKLIITSRRRENLEATQVQVPPMDEETGAKLLGKLAETYAAAAINQAGDSRKRKICRQFGGKPILLDVLARHVAITNCSIDDGINAILSQERGDLGAFLFEDAWKRMDESYRDVFLALGQLGGSVSEQLVSWACAEFACYAPNWLTAFEETRFGALVDYGAHFDITLDAGAREFLSSKFETLDQLARHKISSAVGRVRKKHLQTISAEEEKITDRVLSAFRTTAAKAAKLAASRRDVDEAIRWYEEAALVDSANAALFDRFAWYLMVNDRLDRAVLVAKKACELGPDDADCYFTAGMVAARRAEVELADIALESANRLGKPLHLVSLQKARARLELAVTTAPQNSAKRRDLAIDAIKILEGAIPAKAGNHKKHYDERDRLLARCHGLIESIRPSRTEAIRGS